jgi:hypothetical protein
MTIEPRRRRRHKRIAEREERKQAKVAARNRLVHNPPLQVEGDDRQERRQQAEREDGDLPGPRPIPDEAIKVAGQRGMDRRRHDAETCAPARVPARGVTGGAPPIPPATPAA